MAAFWVDRQKADRQLSAQPGQPLKRQCDALPPLMQGGKQISS